MRKQRFMDQSIMICPACNGQFPIMRNHGQHREKGHIKDIWCPYCKTTQKFREIRKHDFYVDKNGKIVYAA